jgi:hypothetical protein
MRWHGQRRPHSRQLHLVPTQRIEFSVEGSEVLVAPVPHNLVDADAPQHSGALVWAATQGVMGDQVACGHSVTLAPVRNRGVGRGDNA